MSLVDRAKNILFNPSKEWEAIKSEQTTVKDLLMNYVVLLAAIPAVAGFIGFYIFGISWGLVSISPTLGFCIKWAVTTYILNVIAVYVVAFIMDVLATNFGSCKDYVSCFKIVAYSSTAAWVGGIFNLIPSLSILGAIAGIYSLVLLYQGMKIVKQVSQDKLVGYFVTVLIVTIIVYAITGWIVTRFTFGSIDSYVNPF
ncbi:MAG: YIP1 family protein [Ignavibacteria bacterium]|nr:YIP1 family protein [Ignavibacteria bacterium]